MINELKMEELKNLFFYTFGIVPLQYYNVIGDGMTDNRLKIQQAIYDAIEVGAKYIFVPKGNYYYSNELFGTSEVIFVGNSVDAEIRGVTIWQFPDLWKEAQAGSVAVVPIGGIVLYAGANLPENYLACEGQTLNVADYTGLYEVMTKELPEEYPETFVLPSLSVSDAKYMIRVK